jgi:hypothetical protein
MKKVEKAPNWKDVSILNKGLKLFINNEYKKNIDKINDEYVYWIKVK